MKKNYSIIFSGLLAGAAVVVPVVAKTAGSNLRSGGKAVVTKVENVAANRGVTTAAACVVKHAPEAMLIPYDSDFGANGLAGWTVIDANGDGRLWECNSNEVSIPYNSSKTMDDWMITPPLNLEGSRPYILTIVAHPSSSTYPERMEVKFGASPDVEGMSMTLLEPFMLDADSDQTFKAKIMAPSDGIWYVGLHGISDPDMNILFVRSVTVEEGASPLSPGTVTDFVATADLTGAKKVSVSMKAPTTTISGAELTELTKVVLSRGDSELKTFESPQPGEVLNFEDTVDAEGDVTYTAVAFNSKGEGDPVSATCYVGMSVPAEPRHAMMTRTPNFGEVCVKWDAVTEDINGKPLAPGSVKYTVVKYEDGNWVNLKENLTETSYTFTALSSGQGFVQCGVYAVSDLGRTAADAGMIAVGTPYDSIMESFANGEIHYNWATEHIIYGYLDIFNDTSLKDMKSQDGDNGYMGIYGLQEGYGMHFISGLVDLKDMANPALSFWLNNLLNGDDMDEVRIAVNCVDGTEDSGFVTLREGTVAELCGGYDGWQKIIVPLGDYAGKVVQFRLSGITHQYMYKYFDDIRLVSSVATDLSAVSISAPERVGLEESYEVVVNVRNEGTKTLPGYNVTLYADGHELSVKSCGEIKPGEQQKAVFTRIMPRMGASDVVYTASVSVAGDEVSNNDKAAEVTVSPDLPSIPKPDGLTGKAVDEGVELSWNAPDLNGPVEYPVTEDFEDGEPFAAKCGDWVFVDVDDYVVGGPDGINMPGVVPGESKGSFWVWDQEVSGADFTFNARSGKKYLFSLFRIDDGQADDWAISPELSGEAQQVSFYAASYNERWLERVEVWYSEGSVDPADFIKVEGAGGTVPGPTGNTQSSFVQGWTLYTADLPAGAKRFAIRSCAEGAFMLMVDDATFVPGAGYFSGLDIAGYNVYRDGVKINETLVQNTSYLDENTEPATSYVYAVSAVYGDNSESAASMPYELSTLENGVDSVLAPLPVVRVNGNDIVISDVTGVGISVASVDGKIVYSGVGNGTVTVTVSEGIYVVTAGSATAKVVVR